MSRRRSRARAQTQTAELTPAGPDDALAARRAALAAAPRADAQAPTAAPAREASDEAEPDTTASLHRRAVELREIRMGLRSQPAAPTTTVAADGRIALTFPVLGMTCRSCEVRIDKFVRRVPNVERVTASAVRGQVVVECFAPVPPAAIEKAINRAGYEIGHTPWLAGDPRVWATAGAGVLLVAAIAAVASVTGIGDVAGGAGDLASGGVLVALLLGLTAGVSTCMALVGGLVLALSAAFTSGRGADTGAAGRMRPSLVFVGGRIVGYAVFGAALGAVGASVTMPPQLTAVLMIAVALVMLVLGTKLTGLSPRVAGWSPTLPMGLGRRLGLGGDAGPRPYSDARAATLGALSFFLPCGFTQAIQIFALSTGSPLYGAALLAVFAIGTAPGLLALAGLPLVVPSRARPTLVRLVGVVVIGFAVLNGSAGLKLAGFSMPSLVGVVSAAPLPGTLGADGVQRITTYQDAGGYSPPNVVIYAGYPTQWTIQSSTTATCAASIWAPALDIRTRLSKGANAIDLPALPAGTVNYTCAMGMYSGRITVVDAPADGVPAAASAAAASTAPAAVASPPASSTAATGASSAATGNAASAPVAAPTTAPSPSTQELWTAQEENGYSPAVVKIRAGVPTTWHIDSRSQYSCAAYVVVPDLGIEKVLEPGDNVIDLPAMAAGTLRYMCGMGMYQGTIFIE